ncbi:hypothetical protein P154DRAFT_540306 [Amniculicola lignicola CBS 123094]|uniref:C2H2-type domain-containing protein n=1 Tax=Amniculicola lignicola CBS 123094 TaxID=1392246 RepID=A0A6A5VXG3_9PLEO|nr:hypothetical protein P154DRAFT_540306 [Amniculicola lignicola CBS 123094]
MEVVNEHRGWLRGASGGGGCFVQTLSGRGRSPAQVSSGHDSKLTSHGAGLGATRRPPQPDIDSIATVLLLRSAMSCHSIPQIDDTIHSLFDDHHEFHTDPFKFSYNPVPSLARRPDDLTLESDPAACAWRDSNIHEPSHRLLSSDMTREVAPEAAELPAIAGLDLDMIRRRAGGISETLLENSTTPSGRCEDTYSSQWGETWRGDYEYQIPYSVATDDVAEGVSYYPPVQYDTTKSLASAPPLNEFPLQSGLRHGPRSYYESTDLVGVGMGVLDTYSMSVADPWNPLSMGRSRNTEVDDASLFKEYTYFTSLEDISKPNQLKDGSIVSSTPSSQAQKPHTCPLRDCSIQFMHSADITRHLRSKHQSPWGGYRCAFEGCFKKDKIWNRLDSFKNHASSQHPDAEIDDLVRKSTRLRHGLPVSVTTPAMMSRRTPSQRRTRSALSKTSNPKPCAVNTVE